MLLDVVEFRAGKKATNFHTLLETKKIYLQIVDLATENDIHQYREIQQLYIYDIEAITFQNCQEARKAIRTINLKQQVRTGNETTNDMKEMEKYLESMTLHLIGGVEAKSEPN